MVEWHLSKHSNWLSSAAFAAMRCLAWAKEVWTCVKVFFYLAIAIAFVNAPAHAEFWDGNNLNFHRGGYLALERGEARLNNLVEDSYYVGYVVGVADALSGIICCPPTRTTLHDIAAIVSNYMDNHEQEWSGSAESIVREALRSKFPCP